MYTKYLVTGGAGPLGKLIVSMLLEQGKDVRILMSELVDVSEYKEKDVEISYGISTDKDTMKSFFTLDDPRSTVLIHADEYISLTDKTNLNMRRVNVAGTENIIDMCIKRKVGRIVYLGSAYALNPELQGEQMTLHFDRNKVEGEYAKTKAEAAAFVMEKITLNRLNAVLVLPTFIIGPGYAEDHDINRILKAYLKNGVNPIKDGGGHAFVDVRDVATSMIALVENGEAGSGYIVSGEYKTSNEFFQDVNTVKGINDPIKMTPKWVMRKSLSKFVDTYYKITHKENPKNVYALFQDNPQIMYANRNDILPETVISFKETIADTMGEDSSGYTERVPVTEKPKADTEEVKADEVPEKETEDKADIAAAAEAEKKDEEVKETPGKEKEEPAEEVKEPEEAAEKPEVSEETEEEPKEEVEDAAEKEDSAAEDEEVKADEPEAETEAEEASEDKPAEEETSEEEASEDDVTPAEDTPEEGAEEPDKEDEPEKAEESEETADAEDKADDESEGSEEAEEGSKEESEDAAEKEDSAAEDEEAKADEPEAETEEEEASEDDVTPAEEASEESAEEPDKEDEPEKAEESEETADAEDKADDESAGSEEAEEGSKEESEDAAEKEDSAAEDEEEKADEPETEAPEESEDKPADEETSDDVTPAEEVAEEDADKTDEAETADESDENMEVEDKAADESEASEEEPKEEADTKSADDSSLDDDFWNWSPTKDTTDPE